MTLRYREGKDGLSKQKKEEKHNSSFEPKVKLNVKENLLNDKYLHDSANNVLGEETGFLVLYWHKLISFIVFLHVLKAPASNGSKNKKWYFFCRKLWSGLELLLLLQLIILYSSC